MEHSITLGEWLVSGTAMLVAVVTVLLVEVSLKLAKVTMMAANSEVSSIARNADDDMRDVAIAYRKNGRSDERSDERPTRDGT